MSFWIKCCCICMESVKIFNFDRNSDFLCVCFLSLRLYKLISISANMNLPNNNTCSLFPWVIDTKTFISHELECDIVVILICCEIGLFPLVLWMEINNDNTKIIKQIIYFFVLFIFMAEPWIVESWFWNATFSRITTWRSVSQMFVCPF